MTAGELMAAFDAFVAESGNKSMAEAAHDMLGIEGHKAVRVDMLTGLNKKYRISDSVGYSTYIVMCLALQDAWMVGLVHAHIVEAERARVRSEELS